MTATKTICRCNHCSAEIEFETERVGETALCPFCAMDTTLYIPGGQQQPPSPEPEPVRQEPSSQPMAKRIKRRELAGWWSILEIIGWLAFLPGLLLFIAALATMSSAPGGPGFIFACFAAVPLLFGAAMLTAARRASIRWLCSNCGNKLTDEAARICAVCRAPLAVLALGLFMPSGSAQLFTIDDFEDTGSHSGTSADLTFYDAPGAIGGSRWVRMAVRDVPVPEPVATWGSGQIHFDQTDPTLLILSYGSPSGTLDTDRHLHLDLTPWAGLQIEVLSMSRPFDIQVGTLSYQQESGGLGEYSSGGMFFINEPGTYVLPFSHLSGSSDFTDIAGLELVIGGFILDAPAEFTLGQVNLTAVPEPSTYAVLFGLGLVGFALYRRFSA